MKTLIRTVALPAFLAMSALALAQPAVDEGAAEKLMKKSGCNK